MWPLDAWVLCACVCAQACSDAVGSACMCVSGCPPEVRVSRGGVRARCPPAGGAVPGPATGWGRRAKSERRRRLQRGHPRSCTGVHSAVHGPACASGRVRACVRAQGRACTRVHTRQRAVRLCPPPRARVGQVYLYACARVCTRTPVSVRAWAWACACASARAHALRVQACAHVPAPTRVQVRACRGVHTRVPGRPAQRPRLCPPPRCGRPAGRDGTGHTHDAAPGLMSLQPPPPPPGPEPSVARSSARAAAPAAAPLRLGLPLRPPAPAAPERGGWRQQQLAARRRLPPASI